MSHRPEYSDDEPDFNKSPRPSSPTPSQIPLPESVVSQAPPDAARYFTEPRGRRPYRDATPRSESPLPRIEELPSRLNSPEPGLGLGTEGRTFREHKRITPGEKRTQQRIPSPISEPPKMESDSEIEQSLAKMKLKNATPDSDSDSDAAIRKARRAKAKAGTKSDDTKAGPCPCHCRNMRDRCDKCRLLFSRIPEHVNIGLLKHCKGTYPVQYTLTYTGIARDATIPVEVVKYTIHNLLGSHSGKCNKCSIGGYVYSAQRRATDADWVYLMDLRVQGVGPCTVEWTDRVNMRKTDREVTILIDYPEKIEHGGEIERMVTRSFTKNFKIQKRKYPGEDPCYDRLKWWAKVFPEDAKPAENVVAYAADTGRTSGSTLRSVQYDYCPSALQEQPRRPSESVRRDSGGSRKPRKFIGLGPLGVLM